MPEDIILWKKKATRALREGSGLSGPLPSNIPVCPHCAHHCSFDPKTGKLKCKECDFETYLKV